MRWAWACSKKVQAPPQSSGGPAPAACATRVCAPGAQLQDLLDPDVVAPAVPEVVVVDEALGRAQPEVGQADIGTVDGIELPTVDLEPLEVHVVPTEGGLEDVVQAGKSGVRKHEQAAPDNGTDPPQAYPPQYDTQLVDGRGWGWQRSGHSGILASGVTEPFGAVTLYCFARSPDNGHK